jgi:CRISPR-associated protein Cmr1
MIKFTASLQLLTPAFLGGADHNAQAIRLTSLKSALRWWWRVVQWASSDTSDVPKARNLMWQREMALFGSSARDSDGDMGGGQGAFLMRLAQSKCTPWHSEPNNPWAPANDKDDIAYLLGQGLWARNPVTGKHEFTRNALRPGLFTVEFLFRPTGGAHSKEQVVQVIEQLSQALWLLCHFGGLGARARRGWGSLVFEGAPTITGLSDAVEVPGPAQNAAECTARLSAILSKNSQAVLPPFTAFSSATLIRCMNYSNKTPHQVLSQIGKGFKEARAKMRGHDLEMVDNYLQAPVDGKIRPEHAPSRAVFGMPHNYFLKKTAETVTITPANVGDRRASPLLIHLHRWPAAKLNEYAAMYTLLPAEFLPLGESIEYAAARKSPHSVPQREEADVWAPAKQFMTATLYSAISIWPAKTAGKVKP